MLFDWNLNFAEGGSSNPMKSRLLNVGISHMCRDLFRKRMLPGRHVKNMIEKPATVDLESIANMSMHGSLILRWIRKTSHIV